VPRSDARPRRPAGESDEEEESDYDSFLGIVRIHVLGAKVRLRVGRPGSARRGAALAPL
jgi:hypothetical protein